MYCSCCSWQKGTSTAEAIVTLNSEEIETVALITHGWRNWSVSWQKIQSIKKKNSWKLGEKVWGHSEDIYGLGHMLNQYFQAVMRET